jgi:dihydroorotase
MAKNGTIGLESAYGALMTVLPLEKVWKIDFRKNSFGIEKCLLEDQSKYGVYSLQREEGVFSKLPSYQNKLIFSGAVKEKWQNH